MRSALFTRGAVSGACCLALLIAAGCGASEQANSTGSGASDASKKQSVSAAQSRLQSHVTLPTAINVTAPVTSAAATQRTVYWIAPNLEVMGPVTAGIKEATHVLGWNVVTLLVDSSDPQGYSSAMKQAVSKGADYIVASGASIAVYGDGLAAAEAAKIPVIDMYSIDPVQGATNGIYANVGGAAYVEQEYGALTDWAIADSGGDGNIAFVNIPDFPILKAAAAVVDKLTTNCPDCKLTKIDASVTDLTGGGIPQLVVSKLQSDPSIGYVYLAFGDLATGLSAAIDAAGLSSKVKIITATLNPSQAALVQSGELAAGVPNPQRYAAWVAVDAALRIDQGLPIDENQHNVLPAPIFTKSTVPNPPGEYAGPTGYADQFKKLWLR